MMTMRRTLPLLVLLALPVVGGCPKKGPQLTEEEAADPRMNFQAGIESLVPDRKGEVDYAGAYNFFKDAADLGGGKKAHFNAGWTAEKLGDNAKAEMHYRKAFEADASYKPAMFSLARVLKASDKDAEVVQVLKTYLDTHPDDDEVKAEYMDALVSAGMYDEATEIGREILRFDPNSAAVYRSFSSMYLKQGQLQMAKIMGDKALELNDADPNVYNNMGVVALQNDNIPEAIDKFQMARKLDSTHYEANMNLGVIALDAGDYQLALETFGAALERNPSSYDAKVGKAVALRGTGDLDAAGKLYDEMIAEHPERDIAYFNAATLHEVYTKDFTKALKYLQSYKDARAGQLGPNDEVFQMIARVEDAKAAEEERKRLEEERRKAEEERKKRAMELLANMENQVMELQGKLDANAACLDEAITMEVGMALETAADVISMEDTEMATDVKGMLDDYYVPMLDDAIAASCGAGDAGAEGADEGVEGEAVEGAEGEAAETGDSAEGDAVEAEEAAETEEAAAE